MSDDGLLYRKTVSTSKFGAFSPISRLYGTRQTPFRRLGLALDLINLKLAEKTDEPNSRTDH